MGGGEKKDICISNIKSGGTSESVLWVGKYRILVKTWTSGIRSEFFVVDLKEDCIIMKHPQVVWSGNYFNSTAVLHKGKLSVLNACVDNFTNDHRSSITLSSHQFVVNEQRDYVHSEPDSDTCTCTLDLTETPPKWSNWTPAPKMTFQRYTPSLAALGNKIFSFNGKNPEVYEMGSDKWEEITIPSRGADYTTADYLARWRLIQPISDPNNNRIIAYFGKTNSIYAYYHNYENKNWELIHQDLPPIGNMIFRSSVVANEVVRDNLILCFIPDERVFTAYNILTNKWLNVEWLFKLDPHKIMYFGDQSNLVHLGENILCLAISYDEPDHKTLIQFLRFSVELVEEELVQLTPLSFHPIYIDNIYCLADTFVAF